ncbi:hypothetical protein [Sediminicola luteus]|uniref:Uncharacterized protein n=1 Tax=Sediminicola luteus TaxID=319238 RepID=A0A2A4G3U7_9FLAO|nr:hypothetical protein [Sediminicola luteus]PCE62654.1 hypothetical protein B7P33_18650 [Sediminicola luteus]
MEIEQLVGHYHIIGTNQDEGATTYKGHLELGLDGHRCIWAKWQIGADQEQSGTGFFKDNILVINFAYKGTSNKIYKGVVVFRCLTPDILDGFWSEKHGDPNYLGTERAFRVNDDTILN